MTFDSPFLTRLDYIIEFSCPAKNSPVMMLVQSTENGGNTWSDLLDWLIFYCKRIKSGCQDWQFWSAFEAGTGLKII
jgi:hypothetical protein